MILLNIIFLFQLLLIFDNVSSVTEYKNLGVKTTYNDSISLWKNEEIQYNYTRCVPMFFAAIYRHGTRNPGKKDIDRINKIFVRITRETYDIKRTSSLRHPFSLSTAKQLTKGGKEELASIAKRTATSFPNLLNRTSSLNIFISSSLQRAKDSAMAFAKGLDSPNFHLHIRDDLIRYYFRCNQIRAKYAMAGHKSPAKLQFNDFWSKERVERISFKIRAILQAPELKLNAR